MSDIYAVFYQYDSAREELVSATRPEHRLFLRSLFEAGTLLASGPLGQSQALIVVRAANEADALAILDADPMNTAGVVLDREAKSWNPVIGPFAQA